MFDFISGKFADAINSLKNKSVITEKDFESFTRTLWKSLLEADVALQVAKDFIKNIKDQIISKTAIKNFSKSDTIVKIVKDELVKILGNENQAINFGSKKPYKVMMVGLQGSGKTTTSAKLALLFRAKHKKSSLLSSLDVYRPSAQKQLELLAKQTAIESIPIIAGENPEQIAKRTLSEADNHDVIIFDTAGRLHVDNELMDELKRLKEIIDPNEILFVIDSMVGQEALNIAKKFHEDLGLTGFVLTKVDSDTRGGAALSIKYNTGVPVKFMGTGENVNDLEEFHPDRIANRILGMGDIVSLIEKASSEFGEENIESLKKKIHKGKFDFNDLLTQFKTVNKLGGIAKLIKFIPGMNDVEQMIDENVIKKNLAMIHSMTKYERQNPEVINQSRKNRIAKGAAVKIGDVNGLMKKFNQARTMAMKFSKSGIKGMDNGSIKDLFKN